MSDIAKQLSQKSSADEKIKEAIELKRNLLKTLDRECLRVKDNNKLKNLQIQCQKIQKEINDMESYLKSLVNEILEEKK